VELQIHEGRKAGGDPGLQLASVYGGDQPRTAIAVFSFARSSNSDMGVQSASFLSQKGNVG
jgi:hypothetical protein